MVNLIILFDNIDQKPAIEKTKKNGLEIRNLLASHEWWDWTRFEESHLHFSMEGCSWVILTVWCLESLDIAAIFSLTFFHGCYRGVVVIMSRSLAFDWSKGWHLCSLKNEDDSSLILLMDKIIFWNIFINSCFIISFAVFFTYPPCCLYINTQINQGKYLSDRFIVD